MGTRDPAGPARRGRLPRRAVRRLAVGRPGQQRPADAHPARHHPRHPPRVPRGRRRHHRDQHVQRQRDLAGRLRHGGARLRAQPRGRAARPRAPCDEVAERTPGQAALRRRRPRPDHPHRVDLARRQRPRRAQRHATTSSSTPTSTRPAAWSTAAPTCCFIETIFDTLNAKAAIFAVETLFEERGRRWPVVISGTITDASGRTLSGQVTEAFWNSVRHARPLAVGLNCALGAKEMRPYLAELSRVADSFVSAYPNAGLPNAFGEYDETPERDRGDRSRSSPTPAWSTSSAAAAAPRPPHIAAIADGGRRARRRASPRSPPALRLSGLEPFTITEDSPLRQRRGAHQHHRLRQVPQPDQGRRLRHRASVAAQQVEAGAQVIDVNMDEGMIDGVAAMDRFTQADRLRARHQPGAGDGRLLQVGGHRGRPASRPGQADRQLDLHEGGRGEVPRARPPVPQVRRRRRGDGVRRGRPGRQPRAPQGRSASGPTGSSSTRSGSRPRTSSSTPTSSRWRPASRSTPPTASTSSRPPAGSSRTCPAPWSPAASPTSRFSFRGNNPVREAIHAVFLFHAIQAGLDMGIVNAGALVVYDEIDPELRDRDRGRRAQPPRRTPPSGCSRSPRSTAATASSEEAAARVARRCRSGSGSPTRWSRASTPTSRTTPRSCARRSPSAAAARSR